MYSLFKCDNCGAENKVGDTFCKQCSIKFQYSCPSCQFGVTGDNLSCPKCGQRLNWTNRETNQSLDDENPVAENGGDIKRSWLLPLIGLVFVVVIAGVGVYWVKSIAEEPKKTQLTDNLSATNNDSVYTPDFHAPKISNIGVKNINYNTVEISWITDEPSTSQVIWRVKDGNPQSSENKQALVNSHTIELANLSNKTTYNYRVRSIDQMENEALSDEKSFDIGIDRGVAKVEVAWTAMKTIEQQPSVFKTFVNGEIKNTGDAILTIQEIEVIVRISVAGKPGQTEVSASLDPYPMTINPQEVHKFVAEVPNRTDPVYTVIPRIIEQQ